MAVIVELALLPMVPVVTVKVAEVAPAATATELGTVRLELLFVRDTLKPPVGALPLSWTVHVELLDAPRLAGAQDSALTVGPATPTTTPAVVDRPMK